MNTARIASCLESLLLAGCLAAGGCRSSDPFTISEPEVRQRYFYSVVPRDVDEIRVANPWSGEVMYTIRGTNLFDELAGLLEFRPVSFAVHHGCRGGADIQFLKGGQARGQWNFAHGTFFYGRYATEATDRRLADWFAQKGVREFLAWVGTETGGFPMPKSPHRAGLDYLAARQNRDGSWGAGSTNVFLTAFALAAFFNCGETAGSPQHGDAIEQGMQWLQTQEPTTEMDRISCLYSLAAAYSRTNSPAVEAKFLRLGEGLVPENLQEPARTLLALIKPLKPGPAGGSPHGRLAALTAHPQGPPSLLFYLKALHLFAAGGTPWQEYRRSVLSPLAKARRKDGVLEIPGVHSDLESTTFALLALSVPYLYWTDYLDPDRPPSSSGAPSPHGADAR